MVPSFLDELKALRDNVQAQANKTLDVPGSGGRVAVRFRPPPRDDTAARDRLSDVVAIYRMGAAVSPAQEKQLIIDCCDEVLVKDDGGELAQPGDGPLRFDSSDERWGQAKNAHECVEKLYNLDTQPLAISGIVDNLVDWLQGLDAEVHARVEGNSPRAAAASTSAPQPD